MAEASSPRWAWGLSLCRPGAMFLIFTSRGAAESVKSYLTSGMNESWHGVLNSIPVNEATAFKLLLWKWKLWSLGWSKKVRHVGAMFLKGIQSSRQALETLTLQIQKSREGGQANNHPRPRYSAKLFGSNEKQRLNQNVKHKKYKNSVGSAEKNMHTRESYLNVISYWYLFFIKNYWDDIDK